jgi:hypothetical protein
MKRPLNVALQFLITAAIFVFEGDNSAQTIIGRHKYPALVTDIKDFTTIVGNLAI